jgi:DNA-binding NarL/FixJ family response regulator
MNLYIVEDSPHIQNRLKRLVEDIPNVHVNGIAADMQSASSGLSSEKPDAVILDIQLIDGNSLSFLKQLKQDQPELKVLVLTNHATEGNRTCALRNGADCFLDKSTDFEQIPAILTGWQH